MSAVIYLSIGSNMEDRAENIISALSFLQSSGFVEIKKISRLYETSPVGPKQRNFYNIAVKAQTSLNPQDLLALVKQIECLIGRKPGKRWGTRLIDIDILFYNNLILCCHSGKSRNPSSVKMDPGLKHSGMTLCTLPLILPHKELLNRLFVMIPLAEIAPNLKHPVFNRKIKQILKDRLLTLKGQKVKIL